MISLPIIGSLYEISDAETRTISPENITGDKGKGGLAIPSESSPARNLGVGWKVSPFRVIKPGETMTIAEIDGPAMLQSMWFGGLVRWNIILRIYWDEQEMPSVETPLAAFFGYHFSADTNKDGMFPTLNSLPVVVLPNRGLNCFWQMPFQSHCRITLENIGTEAAVTHYQINYVLTRLPKEIAYFHASYRQAHPVTAGEEYVALDNVIGKGRYVGTALFVNLNGDNGCWVEGEVKMFLDGDKEGYTYLASGIEDYFGGSYGWQVHGDYQTYSTPFMGMYAVINDGYEYPSQKRFMMYRWHIMDPVFFQKDITVRIQNLGWRSIKPAEFLPRRDDYSSVAYWYQTLPTIPFKPLPNANELEVI